MYIAGYTRREITYTTIPILKATLNTTLKNIPRKEPQPALILSFKSLLANINSKRIAPSKGPRNIPTTPPTAKPTIPPRIPPTTPQLLPPYFFAPKAITTLSNSVEITESMKSITKRLGVIISKPPFQAKRKTETYTNQTPGSVNTVSTIPPSANIPKNIYINISIIPNYTLNIAKR